MKKRISKHLKKGAMIGVMTMAINAIAIPVYAEDADGIGNASVLEDVYGNINISSISTVVRPTLSISGGTAKSGVTVSGKKISKISVTMKLQKKSTSGWTSIKTWKASKEGSTFSISRDASVSKGTYRTYAKITCSKGGVSETNIYYSASKTY